MYILKKKQAMTRPGPSGARAWRVVVGARGLMGFQLPEMTGGIPRVSLQLKGCFHWCFLRFLRHQSDVFLWFNHIHSTWWHQWYQWNLNWTQFMYVYVLPTDGIKTRMPLFILMVLRLLRTWSPQRSSWNLRSASHGMLRWGNHLGSIL